MSRPYFSLESLPHSPKLLGFAEFGSRLIKFVASRIRNGDYTERGLARILDVSQPQLHNVLKGVRPLRPEFADVLLQHFQITLLDLAFCDELAAQMTLRESSVGFTWEKGREDAGSHILPRRGGLAKPVGRETSPARGQRDQLVS